MVSAKILILMHLLSYLYLVICLISELNFCRSNYKLISICHFKTSVVTSRIRLISASESLSFLSVPPGGFGWTSIAAWRVHRSSCWQRRTLFSGHSNSALTLRSSAWSRWSSGTQRERQRVRLDENIDFNTYACIMLFDRSGTKCFTWSHMHKSLITRLTRRMPK